MDLPTYTNIWRIEKRLYKLYDFRLPMPLPISWIAVFCGITVPYVVVLAAIGVPFDHNLFFLYVLPPGVLTWLSTRPVLENKRLPELLGSQLRYVGEPRTWARMVPLAEKNEIHVYAKVWHRFPEVAEEPALAAASAAQQSEDVAAVARSSGTGRDLERSLRGWRGRSAPGLPGLGLGRPAGAAPEPGYTRSPGRSGPRVWPQAGQAAGTTAASTAAGARAGTGAGIPVRARAGQDRPRRLAAGSDPQRLPGRGEPVQRPAWYDPASRPAGTRGAIPGEVLRGPAASPASPVPTAETSPASSASFAPAVPSGPAAVEPPRRPAAPAPGRPGRQPGWAGQTGAGRGSRGTDRRELARGSQPRGPARPLSIAAPPIEVSHDTHEAQGPAAVPLWGRPAMPRRVTPPPRPAAALGPAAVAAGAAPATPEARPTRALPPAPARPPAPVPPAVPDPAQPASAAPPAAAPPLRPHRPASPRPAPAQRPRFRPHPPSRRHRPCPRLPSRRPRLHPRPPSRLPPLRPRPPGHPSPPRRSCPPGPTCPRPTPSPTRR